MAAEYRVSAQEITPEEQGVRGPAYFWRVLCFSCRNSVSESLKRVRLVKEMSPGLRERLARLRGFALRDESPRLSDESRWYTEHTALLISTLKWALLGAAAGACVGLGTRVFLWVLGRSGDWVRTLTG